MAAKLSDLATGFRPEISRPGLIAAAHVRSLLSLPVINKISDTDLH
jgi:hypothetical protein